MALKLQTLQQQCCCCAREQCSLLPASPTRAQSKNPDPFPDNHHRFARSLSGTPRGQLRSAPASPLPSLVFASLDSFYFARASSCRSTVSHFTPFFFSAAPQKKRGPRWLRNRPIVVADPFFSCTRKSREPGDLIKLHKLNVLRSNKYSVRIDQPG